MWNMQQNQPAPLDNLLRRIEAELTSDNSISNQLVSLGLQAEANGNKEQAAALYAQSQHPIAIERFHFLRRAQPECFSQINIHITSGTPSLLSFLPHSPVNVFPSHQTPVTQSIATTAKSHTEESNSPQLPLAQLTKHPKNRQFAFNCSSEADIAKCIQQMPELDKTVLTNIYKEMKSYSENTTIEAFSNLYNIKKPTLKRVIGRLSDKSLFLRWPNLSSFGEKVARKLMPTPVPMQQPSQALKRPLQTETPSAPPLYEVLKIAKEKAPQTKKPKQVSFSKSDVDNYIAKMTLEEKFILMTLQKDNEHNSAFTTKLDFAKTHHLQFKTIKSLAKKFSKNALVSRWPELSSFGKAIEQALREQELNKLNIHEDPAPEISTTEPFSLSPTFMPMRELVRACETQQPLTEVQTVATTTCTEVKRSDIHKLLM